MTPSFHVQLLDTAAGAALVAAVFVLWRRSLRAIVRTLAVQGVAVAGVAILLAVREGDPQRLVVALALLGVKAVFIPAALLRLVRAGAATHETEPLVNVAASLLAAAALTVVSYAATANLVSESPSPETRVIPIGLAIVLIGFFAMVSRRTALAQAVGFLLLDNGITLVALLAATGVPIVVELGVLLDVLLAVLVLAVLVGRMHLKFGATDLDLLRELRD
jgi:hydrogenase-4 component E